MRITIIKCGEPKDREKKVGLGEVGEFLWTLLNNDRSINCSTPSHPTYLINSYDGYALVLRKLRTFVPFSPAACTTSLMLSCLPMGMMYYPIEKNNDK